MVEAPTDLVVATPLEAVATPALLDDQVAPDVTSVALPSDQLAFAVKFAGSPRGTLVVLGATVTTVTTAGVTVTAELDMNVPTVAEMVAGPPWVTPVTRPCVSTVATLGVSLAQVAESERSRVLPSE